MPNDSDSEVDRLLRAYAAGEVGREELVRVVRGSAAKESTLPELLARVFPDLPLRWRRVRVSVRQIVATEQHLERPKYRLVEALFPSADSFERIDRELFPGFPLTGVSLGDGRVAIVDGHHRLRRFCELAPPDATLEVKLLTTEASQIHSSYLQQVEAVETANGSAAILDLPIKP